MRIVISASTLTQPTYETLEEYVPKRFKKIEKFLPESAGDDNKLDVSVTKSGDLFVFKAEVFHPQHVVVKSKDRDMRKSVDTALNSMVRILTEKVKN